MLNKLEQSRKSRKSGESGFTIIEVMIVLAIAGLILLIVLLAIPALQRNSRNTQIKSDASNIVGAVSTFASDNDGATPDEITITDGLVTLTKTTGNITSTARIQKGTETDTAVTYNATAFTDGKSPSPVEAGKLLIVIDKTCFNANANSRAVAVYYATENTGGTKLSCVNS